MISYPNKHANFVVLLENKGHLYAVVVVVATATAAV